MQFRNLIIAIMTTGAIVACGGEQKSSAKSDNNSTTQTKTATESATTQQSKPEVVTPKYWSYRIVAEYPHSTASYTQGLQYVDGVMWESTGQYGESQLQTVDIATGAVTPIHKLSDKQFGEGITHFQDKIYQLTWLNEEANIYDANGNWLRSIPYKGEGWGITTDGEKLYMSNGSSNINIVDPETLERKKTINVKYGKRPQQYLNELEWIDGKIWANIYTYNEDKIVVIDPSTGAVEAYLDLRSLRNTQHSNMDADVLNGIAYDPTTGHIFVTGKCWNKLFEIEVIK